MEFAGGEATSVTPEVGTEAPIDPEQWLRAATRGDKWCGNEFLTLGIDVRRMEPRT